MKGLGKELTAEPRSLHALHAAVPWFSSFSSRILPPSPSPLPPSPCRSFPTLGFSPVRRPSEKRPSGWRSPKRSMRKSSPWIPWRSSGEWILGRQNRRPKRQRVRHHLIDRVAPHEDFSLAQYLDTAQAIAEEIRSRGRQVLFVGGTPLYLKGLLRGIFEGPPADWQFRHSLLSKSESNAPGWLHDQLKAVDPATAARLHANDVRRIIRALEVFEKTGRPISELQQQFERGLPAEACRVFVIDRPKAELHARIDRRVEAMFAAGLVDEVRRLLADPLRAEQDGPAGGRLCRSYRLLQGNAGSGGNGRTGKNPYPAACQTPGNVVPQPERMPVRAC